MIEIGPNLTEAIGVVSTVFLIAVFLIVCVVALGPVGRRR